MADLPILFSAPMVRALLDGRKTQTRRVLGGLGEQPIVEYDGMFMWKQGYRWGAVSDPKFPPGVRFAIGDRLYVREAWKTHAAYDDISPAAMGGDEAILYEADGAHQTWGYPAISKIGRFRQGMHMPRWASRLTLTVTEVRVQRLQDISPEDARAEGVDRMSRKVRQFSLFGATAEERARQYLYACVWEYEDLWNSLNAARGFGWDANPWVVAVSFTVAQRNIDAEASRP